MRNRYIVFVVMAVLAIVFVGCTRNPEAAKRKYLESGMKYMDQKKYDSAVIQFKKALQIDPRLRRSALPTGRWPSGLAALSRCLQRVSQAVELDPNHFKARLALGSLLMARTVRQYPARRRNRPATWSSTTPTMRMAYVLLGNVLLGPEASAGGH